MMVGVMQVSRLSQCERTLPGAEEKGSKEVFDRV
jgi:hypothetical protein